MSGIVGYVGKGKAWPAILSGLGRLEHRVYDSVGVGTVWRKRFRLARHVGRLGELQAQHPNGLPGQIGIGHTRWATHGQIAEHNCHPHTDAAGQVALVHNGIINNADALLEAMGSVELRSQTDTEILANLIGKHLADGQSKDLLDAVRRALAEVRGTAGVVALWRRHTDRLVVGSLGSPLFVGLGDGEAWVASDREGLDPGLERVVEVDDGQIAEVTARGLRTVALEQRDRARRLEALQRPIEIQTDGPHHMLREIHEQPEVLDRTLRGRLDDNMASARLAGLDALGRRIFAFRQVIFFGCGSSLHSAQVGRWLLERHARMPCQAQEAGEWLWRNPLVRQDALYVAVSQSGETEDTLRALEEINARGGLVAGITNVVGSSIARQTACGVHLHAGAELSVCSTKAFTAQIAALLLLALRLGRIGHLSPSQGRQWLSALSALPELAQRTLACAPQIEALAKSLAHSKLVFFTGRGLSVPVAREGALKLKEVAYIPAEGLAASSINHGPLTLITPGCPVWVIAPPDETRPALQADMERLKACGARLLVIAAEDDQAAADIADTHIPLPPHHSIVSPVLATIPLQLFAYHAAVALDRPVDRPRHLNRAIIDG